MSFLRRSLVSIVLFALPGLTFASSSAGGIDRFHEVNEHLYRGAQPTESGFKYLATIGVKTVLDLREHDERSAAEERVVTGLGMRYINVPMSGLTPPTEAQTIQILKLLEDSTNGAVFVHCKAGKDRTGAVIGAYRVDHDHWNNAQALKEARAIGMSFFQIPRQNYILAFQPRTDGTVDGRVLRAGEAPESQAPATTAPAAAVALPVPSTP